MLLFITISVNLVLFAGLAVWAIRLAVVEDQPRIRPLAWSLAVVALAFVLGAATRLLLVAVRIGWLSQDVGDFVTSEWHLVQSLVATALGVIGLLVARRFASPIRQADRFASAFSERVTGEVDLEALGLTKRESEVLAAIAAGKLSDQEIADELYISPATAGTHVKNILRKAGLSSRRDLALLVASSKR